MTDRPHWYPIGDGRWQHDETGRIIDQPDLMIGFDASGEPTFAVHGMGSRTMDQLTRDERDFVYTKIFSMQERIPPPPLPCPFCGSRPTNEEPIYDGRYKMECSDCHAVGPRRQTEADALAAWNNRD